MSIQNDATELFNEFMSSLSEAYEMLSPVLKYNPEVRATIMALACDEVEIVFAVWREADRVQYKIVKGEGALHECIDKDTPVRVDFAVVPVLDSDDAYAAKEAYGIFTRAPESLQ